jgi:hypothetical protein
MSRTNQTNAADGRDAERPGRTSSRLVAPSFMSASVTSPVDAAYGLIGFPSLSRCTIGSMPLLPSGASITFRSPTITIAS